MWLINQFGAKSGSNFQAQATATPVKIISMQVSFLRIWKRNSLMWAHEQTASRNSVEACKTTSLAPRMRERKRSSKETNFAISLEESGLLLPHMFPHSFSRVGQCPRPNFSRQRLKLSALSDIYYNPTITPLISHVNR